MIPVGWQTRYTGPWVAGSCQDNIVQDTDLINQLLLIACLFSALFPSEGLERGMNLVVGKGVKRSIILLYFWFYAVAYLVCFD